MGWGLVCSSGVAERNKAGMEVDLKRGEELQRTVDKNERDLGMGFKEETRVGEEGKNLVLITLNQ